jgi:hypothetical protein
MKKALIVSAALLLAASAQAQEASGTAAQSQTTSSAAKASTAGNGNGAYIISNSTAPSNSSETLRNVSAGVLGAFASTVNQYDCHFTKAGGNLAGPGASATFQWSENDKDFCVKGWAQAELNRQSTITKDAREAAALQQASTNIKCSLDDDIYRSMIAAGATCQVKPEDYDKRNPPVVMNTDGQKVQTALVYLKAQP